MSLGGVRPRSLARADEQAVPGQAPGGQPIRGYDGNAEKALRKTGGIPLTLRIGVTGHRDLRDPDAVRQLVADSLRWLSDELGLAGVSRLSPVCLEVVTPLAAGADQLVADAVEKLGIAGTALMVPVPADEDSYEASIRADDPAAAAHYRALRHGQHATVTRLAGATADDAGFRRLGEWVVNHCDVLLALWNGEPPPPPGPDGVPPGTAAMVSYALSHPRAIPVIVVPAARVRGEPVPALPPWQLLMPGEHPNPFADLWSRVRGGHGGDPRGLSVQGARSWPLDGGGGRALRRTTLGVTVRHIRHFNAGLAMDPQGEFSALVDGALGTAAGPVPKAARKIEDWASTRFERADVVAGRYQKLFRMVDSSVYVLAALSVLIAAARTIWTPPGSAAALILTLVEILILAGVSAGLATDLRRRLRDRWVCFRAMAEYLRTHMFLALVSPRKAQMSEEQGSLNAITLSELAGPAWFDRGMKAIWQHRPGLTPPWSDADLPALKHVLRTWIVQQADYHRAKGAGHETLHRRFLVIVASLFTVTVLTALVHLITAGNQADDVLNFAAIGIPGIAAAVNSISGSAEHHRHSVRDRAAAHQLTYVHLPAITAASSLRELRRQADIVSRYMLSEATEWYTVMAVHSVEIPT
jgi:hypothetical protein